MVTETTFVVRYAETDQMGIVHHSRYYPWFEVARTEFIKETGISYTQMEQMGILLPLSESGAKYIKGLCYEDIVVVRARLEKLSVARCSFAYEVYKKTTDGLELMATGNTVHAFTDCKFVPMNLKKKFPDIWEKFSSLLDGAA